jgi:hypothetical protein
VGAPVAVVLTTSAIVSLRTFAGRCVIHRLIQVDQGYLLGLGIDPESHPAACDAFFLSFRGFSWRSTVCREKMRRRIHSPDDSSSIDVGFVPWPTNE